MKTVNELVALKRKRRLVRNKQIHGIYKRQLFSYAGIWAIPNEQGYITV